MNNIYLVGFMGTGKTAVGRELARKKKCCFVDLDDLIELKEGRTISDIFARKGEPYFRKTEKAVLKQVAREDNFVVACGGGIVIDKDNIAVMKRSGRIICLSATSQVILERTRTFTHRPLLNVANPKERIDFMLKLRAPFYSLADKTINTSKLRIKEAVDKIVKWLKPHKPLHKRPARSKTRAKNKKHR